ncbi:hypothetical protein GQ53DRAFT_862376 [Thozetella sp. PMI_491]|nr:hypothetical protein GQ53DRAFT_862376 [Thozetella sp. PMI_491]
MPRSATVDALSHLGILSSENITAHLNAILDPHDRNLPKLDCRNPDLSRYHALRPKGSAPLSETKYFFALNLRESLPLLPRLLGSVVEAIRFLGPENCALSIVEGNSPDGTAEVLAALESRLKTKIRTHFVLRNKLDPLSLVTSRFSKLAQLRNLALEPLVAEPERYADATVIFLNDVSACPDDILELLHQKVILGADMTCAMDWIYGDGPAPTFYDVYIARGINGDLFFEVPPNLSWDRATNLFWNDPESKERFYDNRPVQVFACWNGAVAFTARPIVDKEVTFRAAREQKGECYNGEPEIFCKDMWLRGYGKIAVVPYINLEYSNKQAERIKTEKGFTSEWVRPFSAKDRILWKPAPEKVKCMPTFDHQSWKPWNDTNIEEDEWDRG